MIEIGKYNTLKILRETTVGLFLGDEDGEDVLLPNKYCPSDFEIDDELRVFVYLDYDERKIATDIDPKILLNKFALLECVDVTEVGAFMEWGLEKHLLVPFKEQRQNMQVGRWYVVYMSLDPKTDRLYGSNKIEKRLSNEVLTVEEREEVDLVVYQMTDIGFSVIVNSVHKGLIYDNEIFTEISIGDNLKGFVKKIREENKIDISLQPIGYENFNSVNAEKIYNVLRENEGFLDVNDKSSPREIMDLFEMSKKAFKKAVGELYRERKIKIEKDGIKIV